MKAYIKSVDERVRGSVLTGRQAPTVDSNVGKVFKPKLEWTTKQERVINTKFKALYAIIYGIDVKEFKHISKCTIAKEAWEILQIAYEKTSTIKQSKMYILTIKVETLRMKNSKTIGEFYAKLCDLPNEAFTLAKV